MYKWKQELIKVFHEVGAIKRGKFILSSGRQSDIYIDVKSVILDSGGMKWIKTGINRFLSNWKDPMFSSIGGPAMGCLPIIGAMMECGYFDSGFYTRSLKDHGISEPLVGTCGHNPLLIEDTVTSGLSLLECVLALPTKPKVALCVVDRKEGGAELLAEQNIKLYHLLTLNELIA